MLLAMRRALPCQIGNPNGEQEYRGHDSEPEQEAINAAGSIRRIRALGRAVTA